jgi:transposase InsO family protein
MCKVLRVSPSAYYAWRKRPESVCKRENKALIPRVREIHVQMRESYGSRRMADELCKRGVECGRDRARTLMRLADVRVKQKKKFRVTTDSNHSLPVAPNLLDRQFDVSAPNRVWVSDITYVWTVTGWLYLATVMDLFSRRIVGWSMDTSMTRKLVSDALLMAIWRRKPGKGLIHHSDRGSQYCSEDFQNILTQYGMVCSMSRKGNCWDNAVMERFFRSLKSEQICFTRYQTPEDAKKDIIDYIEMFYNSRRAHSYLGYLSPNEYERVWQALPLAA